MFDAIKDMNAIDGVIAELSGKSDRPKGYPFSKITIYSLNPMMARFMPKYTHIDISNAPYLKKLDFKKAGKERPDMVKIWKGDLSQCPDEYIIVSPVLDAVNEKSRQTTACRKYLVEVENKDCNELWQVIQFRKAVKEYITETLNLQITPPIWGDKYPKENISPVGYVHVDLIDCRESLYQALEKYGIVEFSHYPIRLKIPTRKELLDGINQDGCVTVGGAKIKVRI